MSHARSETVDVVVMGGGPAGSTVSTLVARRGHRVVLLERHRFPRYQIGESLLPATIHGICRLLGVSEEIEQARFMTKRGGTFRWGIAPEPWTFAFADAPVVGGGGYAYQVERSRFDAILLGNARRQGVDVREQCTVLGVLEEGGRVVGVRYADEHGEERELRARHVVDAAGNQSRFHALVGERVYSKFFQNVAVFGYFEGGKRLPAPNQGNILSVAFELGWFWYIPLSATLTSVGAVIAREHAGEIQGDPEAALLRFIQACPLIAEYLTGATRVTEGQYGQVRVRKDYSYCNTRFYRPGLVLVGDAACFIDPVFSSGVHLATYSGLLAARSINTCLAAGNPSGVDEERAFAEFERRYRLEFGVFYDFLLGFYDMKQDTDSYFWRARRVLHSEERSNEAFIRLVAGAGTAPGEFFTQRQTIGESFALLVDVVGRGKTVSAGAPPEALRNLRHLAQSARVIREGLEGVPFGGSSASDLEPSADGLSWCEAAALPQQAAVVTDG